MITFDGNDSRQLAVRIINEGKIDDDDNDIVDANDDDANGINVCVQLDKFVNVQCEIRCAYERNN